MLADISHAIPVGRKLRIQSRVRTRGELHRGTVFHVVEPQLSLGAEEQMLGIGRPLICRYVITRDPLFFTFILDGCNGRRESLQFYVADQNLLFASCGVHIPQGGMFTGVVALNESNPAVVGAPLDFLGPAASDSPLSKDRFDGELSLTRRLTDKKSCRQKTECNRKLHPKKWFH